MSFSADNIIQINTAIRAAGLSTANFASACLFVTEAEAPTGFLPDTFRSYSSINELSTDFNSETPAYASAERWLGGIPTTRNLMVYVRATDDTSWAETLDKARNQKWWYFTFLTAPALEVVDDAIATAQWCESNGSFFANNQTGTNCAAIRDFNGTGDIASQLTALGIRHCATFTNAEDGNSGNAALKHLAKVNFNGLNTTITLEGKKSPGVLAEELTTTEYRAMLDPKKKAVFYTMVDLQGSTDVGRWQNTYTHSSYGEYIDDVFNLDAFVNGLTVELYNAIQNQPQKLPQTPVGQAFLINKTRLFCEKYIANGYLGPRNYVNPDTGEVEYTIGYTILTKDTDILDLTDVERDERYAAPLRLRIFRAGAIHKAIVDIDVY